MHILASEIRTLDETVRAVDLGQSPAEIVFLSFSDSDLGLMAAAHAAFAARAGREPPTLRLANLSALRHPYSVDLYLEKVAAGARLILVRLLGGTDYWRYGVDELSVLARRRGIDLAFVPGDDRPEALPDVRLAAASTLADEECAAISAAFAAGGPDNAHCLLARLARRLGIDVEVGTPVPQLAFGALPGWSLPHAPRDESFAAEPLPAELLPDGPRLLIVSYRAQLNAGDIAAVEATARAFVAAGFTVLPVYVTSLKDAAVAAPLTEAMARFAPDAIVNMTAFSARRDSGGTLLDQADVPVFQAPLAATWREAWAAGSRGLTPSDLAMNVVMPEVDGRILAPVVSFKAEAHRLEALEYAAVRGVPEPMAIDRLVRLVSGWTRLRRLPRGDRRLALVLSNYQGRGGRTAHAVGLDGPASIAAIADDLRNAGYAIGSLPGPPELIAGLEGGAFVVRLPLTDYRAAFDALPDDFRAAVRAAWGEPESDRDVAGGAFVLKAYVAGALVVAVQPDRGRPEQRAQDHHDPNLPPRHGYVAFYLWLRRVFHLDAMIHLGTHGTLEWLPGKSVALSESCAPAVLADGLPVVYPFIVNNPGEAAQAKRRIAAVTLGHLTPPLVRAGAHGILAEIETLTDEFAAAQSLDARRARHLADAILERVRDAGIAEEAGLGDELDDAEKLARLDAWICDIKDMRIADGLHVFGRPPERSAVAAHLSALGEDDPEFAAALVASAEAERRGLLLALDGRFVPPGPSGAPGRNRRDVLPTGRNLYAVDPRAVPTRAAWEIGRRTAEAVVARYAEDHGDWPASLVLDVWASATMRTGGDDIAQALALLGVRPVWDGATARVSGFEVMTPAEIGRPRVDVSLRVSGLFRDVFEGQIALFDAAVCAVAARDEPDGDNPLFGLDPDGLVRVFGGAPGNYGAGVSHLVDGAVGGPAPDPADLAKSYLAASGHGYGASGDRPAGEAFAERLKGADAFVHVQDLMGQDLLSNDAFASHEGGFAAAVRALGGRAEIYHVDASGDAPKARPLAEEIARVVRGRAANPRWIAGQMRHGHRGAAEIAEAIANLCAFATLSGAVAPRQFDLVFDATFGDDAVRDFLVAANPDAARDGLSRLRDAIDRRDWPPLRNSVIARLDETEAMLGGGRAREEAVRQSRAAEDPTAGKEDR